MLFINHSLRIIPNIVYLYRQGWLANYVTPPGIYLGSRFPFDDKSPLGLITRLSYQQPIANLTSSSTTNIISIIAKH